MVTSEQLEYFVVDELVCVDAPEEVDVVELGQGDAVVVDQVGQAEEVLDVPGTHLHMTSEETKVDEGTDSLIGCVNV